MPSPFVAFLYFLSCSPPTKQYSFILTYHLFYFFRLNGQFCNWLVILYIFMVNEFYYNAGCACGQYEPNPMF